MQHDAMQTLSFADTAARLSEGGIPVSESRWSSDVEAAVEAAAELGAPVVLKAGGLNHKSDVGGVVVGLPTLEAVRDAAHQMLASLGADALPFIVQHEYVGTEILLGIRREQRLGAVVVVGMGGVHAEVLSDAQRLLVPFDRDDARLALARLRGWPLLQGHRRQPGVDLAALCDLMVELGKVAENNPDIVELDMNPVLVGAEGDGVAIVDARAVVSPAPLPRTRPTTGGVEKLVTATSVAVVGASDDPRTVGGSVLAHLIDHGFRGDVVPVHPRGGQIRGLKRVQDLSDLDEPVDLVCVAVGAERVPAILRQAADMGCGAAIVHSSGFAEAGASGARLQEEIADIVVRTGLRVLGPNSMGLVSPRHGLAASLSSTANLPEMRSGSISLVSSSGALGSCLSSRLLDDGLGLAHWISLGNESDIDAADCLEFLSEDPYTRIVGLVLERITDGPRFIQAGRRALAAGKALFAYPLARTAQAANAAASHTGAMVGSHEIRSAVLEAAGVVAVHSLQDLQDVLGLGASQPLPRGGALGALTASGGACTIIVDEVAAQEELTLPAVSEETFASLRGHLPDFASYANPLDATAAVINDPTGFVASLETFSAAGLFDALLVQFTTNADPAASEIAERLVAITRVSDIPVYVARYGAPVLAPQAMDLYRRAGLQVLDTPEQLVRAVGALVRAGAMQRQFSPAGAA